VEKHRDEAAKESNNVAHGTSTRGVASFMYMQFWQAGISDLAFRSIFLYTKFGA
jgi:hypothetical protein